jgi:hypothetical protein
MASKALHRPEQNFGAKALSYLPLNPSGLKLGGLPTSFTLPFEKGLASFPGALEF